MINQSAALGLSCLFDKGRGLDNEKLEFSVFQVPQDFISSPGTTIKDYIFHFYPQLDALHKEIEEINQKLMDTESDALLERQKELYEEWEHLKGWDISNGYESYLKFFGHEDFSRDVNSLSGGEQKKILLSIEYQ